MGRNRAESEANKGRVRYKTQTDDEPPAEDSNKKSIFKRAHNDSILKDKTFIDGYLRGKQLGRGGFSKVWEGFHFKTKTFYAIKEIDTTNKYQTHLTEIWFGNFFFEDGEPKK
jgi:serine/threonine protein kinase